MPDALEQLSKAIGRKVTPIPVPKGNAEPHPFSKTAATPVSQPSQNPLEKIIGHPLQVVQLPELPQARVDLYQKALKNGFDSKRALHVAMSQAAVMGQAKPESGWQKLQTAVGKTETGRTVEDNLADFTRSLKAANEKLSNPFGGNDEEWKRLQGEQKKFFEEHLGKGLAAGAATGAAEFGEGLLSPYQMGLMVGTFGESALARMAAKTGIEGAVPAARTLSKLMQLQFASQMVEGAASGAEQTYKAATQGNWEAAGNAAIQTIASAWMGNGLMSHEAAESRVRTDLEKTARQMYGTPGEGVKAAVTSRFDQLNPFEQARVIDATVKASPEYSALLKEADAQSQQAKDRTKKQRQKKLQDYYGRALEQAWNPSVSARTMRKLERSRQWAEGYKAEEERRKGLLRVVGTIREAAQQRAKAMSEEFAARRAAEREARPERKAGEAQARTERERLADELQAKRDTNFIRRQEATEAPSEAAERHVAAQVDGDGNVSYPANYWGEDNSFGVASDVEGHAVYRKTPRGVEWLDADGNFSETPENLYNVHDPETADTLARLSALSANADSLADAEDATEAQKKDAEVLADIRRQLVSDEISTREAQKRAGIAERPTVADDTAAARDGQLNGPFHESSPAQYLDGLREQARNEGMSEDETAELLRNAHLLARQETESNLNHVYRAGDYIVSKRGVRWTLDSKGMLHPSDGGQATPLMRNGFYSNQAVQLAESGRIGYGTETREERRVKAAKRRAVEDSIRENQEKVDHEMRLAVQREGLHLAAPEEPRPDLTSKAARERRRMSRPPRAPESPESQIVRMVLRAPSDEKSVINTIARQKQTTPEEVMRLQLATDPRISGTPQQKAAGLEIGDRVTEPVRKAPWVVEQGKDGNLYLRTGNAQPLKLDRLNPSQSVLNLLDRGTVEKDISQEDIRKIAFENPHYYRWQQEQVRAVEDRAEGKVQDPEPQTPVEAEVQAEAAKRRADATESAATVAKIEALDPKTDSVEEAVANVEKSDQMVKTAEEAYAQAVEAQAKTEPKSDFPQRAPVTIGARGRDASVVQNSREVPVRYELVPLKSLVTSHGWRGDLMVENPEFPQSLQPRTINEAESKLNAIRAEVGKYDFRQYADQTINGSMGPAIVDEGGQVVGGNTRLAILRKHIENLDGIADPEERAAAKAGLRSAMRQLAEQVGIPSYPADDVDYAVVRMMKKPIEDSREAAELGRLFNKKIGVEISQGAKGISYAKSFDEPLLNQIARRIEQYDGITPAMRADPDFFSNIVVDRFDVSPEEFANWFESVPDPADPNKKKEQLHDAGRAQFTKALLGTIVQDTSVLNRVEGHTPFRALERALGYIMEMKGIPSKDLTKKIVEAMRATAQTIATNPELSASRDQWLATYRPEQTEFLGMETDYPPEPDRMVEALWRAMNAGVRTLNDRLKNFIGEDTSQQNWIMMQQEETPSEAFNRVFRKELKEVAFSRGDKRDGLTPEEFNAALQDRELSDQEREESQPKAEEPKVEEPKQEPPPKVMEPPPVRATPEEKATERLALDKTDKGYVTPDDLKQFLETNPATKEHAPELMRTAKLMAEYVWESDPPVGVDKKDALAWILKERVARLEQGELKTKRGEYSDPLIEKGIGTRILKLHQAATPDTFIHEFAHVIFPFLSDEDLKAVDTIGEGRAWSGHPAELKGAAYAKLSEKLAHGLEQFLRDENPTGFTHEVKAVLAKVKNIMRKTYLMFKGDPLSEFANTEESREVFAKMFGITDFDVADDWRQEVKKARAQERKMKKPSEEPHPLARMASEMGAKSVAPAMEGRIEDSVGERVDPRKPTAVLRFGPDEQAAALAWAKIAAPEGKIENAELIQNGEGDWGIRFNTKTKPPSDILNQELPERHPGVELEDLQKRLDATPERKIMERRLLQMRIDNLKNRIRAAHGAEPLEQAADRALPQAVREEVRSGSPTDRVRTATHGVSGIRKPARPGEFSKPPKLGMPRHAGAEPARATPRSLTEVREVALEPLAQERGAPKPVVEGGTFDHKEWVDGLKRSGLPETMPPPTWSLNPDTAQILKYPGQKQIVASALSALEQGDGYVMATPPGSGKTFTSLAAVKEYREEHPEARVLYITKNRALRMKVQRVAANSFGFHVELDTPDMAMGPGVHCVSYAGMMRDAMYKQIPWDLVVADESGEARRWYDENNKQGKTLKDLVNNSKKALYLSATPFHSPMEYGYLDKLNLWPKGQFDKWIEQNFAHEKVGDKIVARLDPARQAKLRQQLIERGQMVSQAISYDGMTAHFGVVPVSDSMKRGLDRIREGFARARDQFVKQGKKGMAEKAAAFEATYTKAWLERQRLPEAIELARKAREQGWHVGIFSETSAEDLFRRPRGPNIEPSTYQELDDAMGGQLSKIIPPFENVYNRLHQEFGDQIGDYSGRGNTQAERDRAINEFLTGQTKMLYSTYAAGGIGVDMHDADYPELNVKGGDKPRVFIFLGPPYSGVLLEQAMGRPWRLGVKSDTHLVFLATDSEPDIRLMQTKIGPRMKALRAAVLGEKDSLASVMQTYTDDEKVRARQDMLAYAEGDEVKVNAGSFQVRSKRRDVGIADWSQIHFPSAEEAKNKGMRYGEEVPGGDWSTLFQSKYGMRPPETPENEKAAKIIDAVGNAAVTGKIPEVQNLDPAERQAAVGVAAANATADLDLPVDRDKDNAVLQSMKTGLRDGALIPYHGLMLTQEQGMVNIARMEGNPDVGYNLRRMNRSYRAEWDVYVAQMWNMLEDSLKRNTLKPTDDVMREVWDVVEGKKTTENPAIERLSADVSDMMAIVHDDLAKDGVKVTTKEGEKIPYSDFPRDPHYMPHRIDWNYELADPLTGEKKTVRQLLRIDEKQAKRILDSVPELRRYSYGQIMSFLGRNDPRAPRQANIHFAREVNFPFIEKDYKTLLGYFDQAAQSVAAARNFGADNEKLNHEIKTLRNPASRETLNSMFRTALQRQNWEGATAKMYNAAIAYETASKMTFSAFKVPYHLALTPSAMQGRVMPLLKALARTAIHPKEVLENAAYVGSTARQLDAAELLFGERLKSPVRQILRTEGFESAYKMVRAVAGESARVYLDQYALNDLRKGGTAAEHTRRMLRDVFLIGDHAIDEAVRTGRFSPEDSAKAQTGFTNLAAFSSTGDPLQMPQMARLEQPMHDSPAMLSMKRAVRLTYALQSFSVKAMSLLREHLYDEVVVHHNMKPLMYALIAYPVVGTMLNLTSTGARHVVSKAVGGLTGKKPGEDSWDKYIAHLQDTFEHPDAVKFLKWYIDSWTLTAGAELLKTAVDPLIDVASGRETKSDQYWMPDILEHIFGTFYSDIYQTGKELGTIQKIHAGKHTPESHKMQEYKRSLLEYGENEVPVLRQIPWIEEQVKKPKKAPSRNFF